MDARLSDEQELIRETAVQLAARLGPLPADRLPAKGDGAEGWQELAAIGLLGMRIPERAGGSPASGVEVALVAEALGAHLVPLPFLASAVAASELLCTAGAEHALLERLARGDLRVAPVLDASLTRWARPGEPGIAWDARGAEAGLCVDPASRRLRCVELGSALESQDLTRELRGVSAGARALDLGDLGGAIGADALDRALALWLAALCADAVGAMQGALDLAVAYVREREQFGVPVGSFQAVQHLAAEAHVSVEGARGCTWHAAWAADALDAGAALEAARVAKAYGSEHAREVCETAIQLHGGIGLTWEALPHVFLRRALLDRLTLGDETAQLEALADLHLVNQGRTTRA
jgi:alkylation response protein AidB-like acyl-CoA dehydrogenase